MSRVAAIVAEPVEGTHRRAMTDARKRRVHTAHDGRCADPDCRAELPVSGPAVAYDHRIPLELGGADDDDNLQPMCFACHARKTARDLADIARAKRRAFKHAGGRKPSAGRIKSRGFEKWTPPDFGVAE